MGCKIWLYSAHRDLLNQRNTERDTMALSKEILQELSNEVTKRFHLSSKLLLMKYRNQLPNTEEYYNERGARELAKALGALHLEHLLTYGYACDIEKDAFCSIIMLCETAKHLEGTVESEGRYYEFSIAMEALRLARRDSTGIWTIPNCHRIEFFEIIPVD